MPDLTVLFQSTRYDPTLKYEAYLHCSQSGRLIVTEREEAEDPREGYVVRAFVLPEEDYPRYTKAIAEAKRLQEQSPGLVNLILD